ADDVIETREVAFEICVATFEERALLTRPDTAARRFAVLGIKRIGHLQAFDDPAERYEWLSVMRRRVVTQVDEDLRRSPLRDSEGIGDGAVGVRLAPRVVGN